MSDSNNPEEPLLRKDRDPNQINAGMVKVDFEDVFAEPDHIRSLDLTWKCSKNIYRVSKRVVYGILAALFCAPLTLLWSLHFALLSFCHIWIVEPCTKSCMICCHCLGRPCSLVSHTVAKPLCSAMMTVLQGLVMALRKKS